jgi:hypothetical protein
MTLRRLPAVAQQLQLPKASAGVRARAAVLVTARALRRQWPVVLVFVVVVAGALLRHFTDGGR